jgi:HK97 gp10 family phage protein
MPAMTAKWSDLNEAIRTAEALGRDVATDEVIGKALLSSARPLLDDIVRTCPRSHVAPHVADTFVVKVSREEREFGRSTVLVGPRPGFPGFVASFLEFGTSKMSARPFIRPAYDSWRAGSFPGELVEAIRKQYERVVKKYVRRAAKRGA